MYAGEISGLKLGKATRDAFGDTLKELGAEYPNLVTVDGDVGNSTRTEPFMKASSRVASVVAYFPPTDLRGMTRGLEAGTTGRFPALNYEREKAPDYSPIVFVTPDDPPTLLIHGRADRLVPLVGSQALVRRKPEWQLEVFDDIGHVPQLEAPARFVDTMVRWLRGRSPRA